jgi:hypothetical protein
VVNRSLEMNQTVQTDDLKSKIRFSVKCILKKKNNTPDIRAFLCFKEYKLS